MSLFRNTIVDSTVYNSIPSISVNRTIPKEHEQDLQDLRAILAKHDISDISIRLIHKHFDVQPGEVVAFSTFTVPPHKTVKLMKPVKASQPDLHSINYFVDEDGFLQAYEYGVTKSELPITSNPEYTAFAAEFIKVIKQRNLEHKFGLKIRAEDLMLGDDIQTTEMEVTGDRATVTVPGGMPLPPDNSEQYSVVTEWDAQQSELSTVCTHGPQCYHPASQCRHRECRKENGASMDVEDGDNVPRLGGEELEPGSALHDIVSAMQIAV